MSSVNSLQTVFRAGTLPRWKIWWLAARPKTLWAAVSPVLVGTALAYADGAMHLPSALIALLCALLIQVGTNLHNDYADYEKGADTSDRKGPLRVTQAGLLTPTEVKYATWLVFGITFLLGLYLVYRGGWVILVIGVLSILSGLWYTGGKYSLAYLGLADLFVIFFFGIIAVGGTYYVQALQLSPYVLIAGLGPGLLANALLVVNNLRDIEEDRKVGKRTLVVRLGKSFARFYYTFCIYAAAFIPIFLFVMTGVRPWSMMAAAIIFLARPEQQLMRRYRDPRQLNRVLGKTSRLLFIYSLLFALGQVVS